MFVANFTHPLTAENKDQIEKISNLPTSLLYAKMAKFDPFTPLQVQIEEMVQHSDIDNWTGILVNLPGHSVAAALLLQELQKRSEYFYVLQLRPITTAVGTKYEVVEWHRIQGFVV